MTTIAELLRRFWGLSGALVEPLGGGINSETWLIRHDASTFVAKRVPSAGLNDLVAGCEVAAALAAAGVVTGPPVPTSDGRLVLTEHRLTLLEYVPGQGLDGETDDKQRRIASTLAGVHLAGGAVPGLSASAFMTDWLAAELPGVAAHPWLVRVVKEVRAETDALPVTWSVLHTDPSPRSSDATPAPG
jgi:Ser/Thr protein kinase RdoA (MazF antagonist)